jgi:hypothetical protein
VNAEGYEGGNSGFVQGRTLPWLQDTGAVNAWALWTATLRDVFVLDADNRVTAIFNLDSNDLNQEANRDALKALLRAAATP